MNRDPELQKFLDELAGDTFGRTLSEALEDKVCVDCGKSVLHYGAIIRGGNEVVSIGPDWAFRDDLSRREYRISGLCQECQDSVFTEPEEEAEGA